MLSSLIEEIKEDIQYEFPNSKYCTIYFDTAGRSVLPKSVYESGMLSLPQKLYPWHGIGNKTDEDDIRELFSELIGCPNISITSSDIAIVPSAAFAITLIARNIAKSGILKQGKTVLILENEMGSVVYPWQEVCKQVGAEFKVIPNPFNDHNFNNNNNSWMDLILQSIDDSVAVLSLPFVHWCNGSKVDLLGISKYLLDIDAKIRPLLVIDGTQSIGALNLNLADFYVQPCVIACSVHKWINGPYGMSLLYINKDFHENWEPLDFHERGRMGNEDPEWDEIIFMNKESGFYPTTFYPGAKKFDSGGKKNPILIPMVKTALRLTLSFKAYSIQLYLTKLTEYMIVLLQNIFGQHIIVIPKDQRSGHIVANPKEHLQKNICKVLISGSTGWLGQHLYQYLLQNIDYIEVYAAYKIMTHFGLQKIEECYYKYRRKRLSNMIGSTFPFSSLNYGNNKFLQWIYNSFKRRDFIGLKDKEDRSFVWIEDVLNILKLTIQAYYDEMFNEHRNMSIVNMKSIVSSSRIFNVGGPIALSRLDIAKELCTVMDVNLLIRTKDDEEKLDKNIFWKVYILEQSKKIHQNDENIKLFENLNSPLNISMNPSETEIVFNTKFTDIRTLLYNCL